MDPETEDSAGLPGEDQELYEHHRIEVDKGQSPLRIDKFLANRLENISRNRIQVAADAGSIRVNGKPVKPNYKVRGLDLISVVLPQPIRDYELVAQDLPIDIVFEDEDLLVVNKSPGMVVHPAFGNYDGTLVNALLFHFKELGNKLTSGTTENQRPGLVHRIDKNTSGLLVIARNEMAMTILAREFFERKVNRNYYALVWGDLLNDSGTIEGHVGRSLKDRKVMQVFPDGSQGKHAVTHYKVLERFRYVTLVQCKLETGRTHQIRVHFANLGHPLFSDVEYGGNQIVKGPSFSKYKQFVENCFKICPRQALHAKTLEFTHPTTGKKMKFDSDLPEDFSKLIEKWRVLPVF